MESESPSVLASKKLQAFLTENAIELLPIVTRIEGAGAGRYVIDLNFSVNAKEVPLPI
jgi:hypothetical protein